MRKTFVRRLLAVVIVATFTLGLAAVAADLGGTVWQLDGVAKDKIKKIGKSRDSLGETLLYFYDDNTCVLRVYDNTPNAPEAVGYEEFGCTWESPEGSRKFIFEMDGQAIEDLLVSAWEDLAGGEALDGTLIKNIGKGKVSKGGDKIKLKLVLKAEVTGTTAGSAEQVTRKVSVKLKATGRMAVK